MSDQNPLDDPIHLSGPSNRTLVIWGCVALATVLVFAIGLRWLTAAWSNSPTTPAVPAASDSSDQLAIAAARIELQHICDQANQVLASVNDLDAEIKAWQAEVIALLTNERGKALAARTEHIEAFRDMHARPRPSSADSAALRKRVSALLDPVQKALTEKVVSAEVPPTLVQQLKLEGETVQQAIELYRKDRKTVDAWLANAGPPSSATLKEAIDAYERDIAQKQAEGIRARMEATRKEKVEASPFEGQWYCAEWWFALRIEGAKGFASLTRASDKVQRDSQVLTIESFDGSRFQGQRLIYGSGTSIRVAGELLEPTKLRLKDADAELFFERTERDPAALKLERVRALAQDAEVQSRYRPFLEKGRFIWGHGSGSRQSDFVDGPARRSSYNDLVRLGLTRDLKVFINAGIGQNYDPGDNVGYQHFAQNDRPLWVSKYPQSDAEWARYRKLFADFAELAPAWREMDVLAP